MDVHGHGAQQPMRMLLAMRGHFQGPTSALWSRCRATAMAREEAGDGDAPQQPTAGAGGAAAAALGNPVITLELST